MTTPIFRAPPQFVTGQIVGAPDLEVLRESVLGACEAPWTVQVRPFFAPVASTTWSTVATTTTYVCLAYLEASTSVGSSVSWDITVAPGTWTLELLHRKQGDYGIITVTLGGNSVGTIDGYAGAGANNSQSTITGYVSSTSAKQRLTFTISTKNAGSSAYGARIQLVTLIRTA